MYKIIFFLRVIIIFFTAVGIKKTFIFLIDKLNKKYGITAHNKQIRCLQIEITTRCNLKCITCEHTYWEEESQDMTFLQFKSIIDSLPNLIYVIIAGIGETMLNKEFVQIIKYLSSKRIFVDFTTNFTIPMDNQFLEDINKYSNRIIISVDGASKQTYESVRINSNFDKILNNLEKFLSLRATVNKILAPITVINFVITKDNFHEIPIAVEMFGNYGIDSIYFLKPTTFKDNQAAIRFDNIGDRDFREVYKKAKYIAKRKKILLFLPNTTTRNSEKIFDCSFPNNSCFINCNGDVYPCCYVNQRNMKRSDIRKFSFGNIFELKEKVSFSHARNEFITCLNNKNIPFICKRCPLFF